MKASLVFSKRVAVSAYYLAISIFIFVCSVILPFQYAEIKKIAYMNNLFSEYKQANQLTYVDVNSPVVEQIIKSGREFEKSEYKKFSGTLGLLSCAVVLGLTLFISFARATDVIWIGGYFSVLFAYGSMSAEFIFGIVLLLLIAYYLKRGFENQRKLSV